jgi:hypothetical protein
MPPADKIDNTRAIERTRAIPEMTVRLKTDKTEAVLEIDLETGACARIDAEKTADGWLIKSDLAALGSRLFVATSDQNTTVGLPVKEKLRERSKQVVTLDEYPVVLSEANVLPLTRAELKIADGDCCKAEVLELDDLVRRYLQIQCRGGAMEQPWVRKNQLSERKVKITLKYGFDCESLPAAPLYLGIERPESFKIHLNGKALATDKIAGWWCDKSLKKLEVDPTFLNTGNNELLLECDYSEAHPGLEYIYLLGDFGVRYDGLQLTMTPPVRRLKIGDWSTQGLPFYSGAVSYQCELNVKPEPGEHIFIKLPEYRGSCVKITVNGKTAGVVAWAPDELEITEYLLEKDNEICIEVISSRRNSHGPLFHAEQWPTWTGPEQFRKPADKYNLVPCGLLRQPEFITKS